MGKYDLFCVRSGKEKLRKKGRPQLCTFKAPNLQRQRQHQTLGKEKRDDPTFGPLR
jgi:hypothetical protein